MNPDDFYTLFSQLSFEPKVPKTLVKYTKALYKHQNVPLGRVHLSHSSTKQIIQPPIAPKKKIAILAFSGGLDSTATLIWAQKHGYTVYPVFIDMLNPSISYREKKAVQSIARKFNTKLIVLEHDINMRRETSYKKHDLHENPAKNQYIWLRCLPIAIQYNAGTIFFGDTERPEDEEKYFSDTHKSYAVFQEHTPDLIKHPPIFKDKVDAVKLLWDTDPKLFYKTASCYSRPVFFKSNNRRSGAPKNMCGMCFKCKRLIEVLQIVKKQTKSIQNETKTIQKEQKQPKEVKKSIKKTSRRKSRLNYR